MTSKNKATAVAEPLLTIPDVAALWRCSKNTVYRRIADGELRIVGIGNRRAKTRVPASALVEYASRRSRTVRQRGAA